VPVRVLGWRVRRGMSSGASSAMVTMAAVWGRDRWAMAVVPLHFLTPAEPPPRLRSEPRQTPLSSPAGESALPSQRHLLLHRVPVHLPPSLLFTLQNHRPNTELRSCCPNASNLFPHHLLSTSTTGAATMSRGCGSRRRRVMGPMRTERERGVRMADGRVPHGKLNSFITDGWVPHV
jgi:hypothetical protein